MKLISRIFGLAVVLVVLFLLYRWLGQGASITDQPQFFINAEQSIAALIEWIAAIGQ